MSIEPSDPIQDSEFASRHIGPSLDEIDLMLEAIGVKSLGELIGRTVPSTIRNDDVAGLGEPMSEAAVLDRLRCLAAKNQLYISLIGMGYYGTHTPAVIQRNVLENPGWYTAYTPYQAEISQGRLEAMLNFQTMVSDLTGMDLANASMLDEATAAAEAMTMLRRIAQDDRSTFFVSSDCLPQTIEVIRTRAGPVGIKVVVGDPMNDLVTSETYGVLLQFPGVSGRVNDDRELIATLSADGVLVAVAADLLALTMLTPPGELGADVVVGTTQRFGVPMMFGGPHAGYLATREQYKRTIPGRLVGVSRDAKGRMALRLALVVREQHIRRGKATSNICTAQVLLAVMAGMYAVYHGPEGLRAIAERTQRLTSMLAAALRCGEVEIINRTWFDTLTIRVPGRAEEVVAAAAANFRINLRLIDSDTVGISLDETTTSEIVDNVLESFAVDIRLADVGGDAPTGLPPSLVRTSTYLDHPVFRSHHSETEMLRYLRKLQQKDIALDRSMIALGSCTMKLNAVTALMPITWPEFAALHPFVPLNQAQGYLQLFDDLEKWLGELTGYDAISLQPNAGSQGEFAGLLAIKSYHRSRGEDYRDICLIPASAHGTNPASAVMAGMQVIVVNVDDRGDIDTVDLQAKAFEHSDRLAALMITYPSTHGVYEESIREVCAVIHENGGQVYIDGANLNALLGIAKFGEFGGDVSHFNLHKTFTIPHGGGGPGVGPIGVRAHLEPFLPNYSFVSGQRETSTGIGSTAAAPWGSAGVLPIPWAYISLMGARGLRRATEVAVLSANYLAHRLAPYYPILYTGRDGMVAHECILDARSIRRETGVSVEDIAKRLIDYGFHAPTMSFPVVETLMIEPTESESKVALDRFCDAMIAIRAEIDAIADGQVDLINSPLHHAPHTAEDVVADDWSRAYSREDGAYPVTDSRGDKYWPPVSRVDHAYGDRNVMCSCPPVEYYQ